jgi:hypothetical protein
MVFVTPQLNEAALAGLGFRAWIRLAPTSGPVGYPVILDAADGLLAARPDCPLASRVHGALAPGWQELADRGIAGGPVRGPGKDEVGGNDNAAVMESFLHGAVVRTIGAAGDSLGIVLRGPQHYDGSGAMLVDRLLDDPSTAGTAIVMETTAAYAGRLAASRPELQVVALHGGRMTHGEPATAPSQAARIVAQSAQGVPLSVLELLGAGTDGIRVVTGPSGVPWACLSAAARRRALSGLTRDTRERLRQALFDVWSPEGWGYLRRAPLAISARSAERMCAQHAALLYGGTNIAIDLLYRHFAMLAAVCRGTEEGGHARIGAARIASRTWGSKGLRQATAHYRRAIAACLDPLDRVVLIYEMANVHAIRRDPSHLAAARQWYDQGWRALDRIDNPAHRIRAEIMLCNGLALVAYHAKQDAEALALEQRGLDLLGSEDCTPEIRRWAMPLLNVNTAKLYEKRFGDIRKAAQLLQQVTDLEDPRIRERAAQDLARLWYDEGRYQEVVDLLKPSCEGAISHDVNEHDELFRRSIYTVALIACGERGAASLQTPRLAYLTQALRSSRGQEFVACLERACA